LHGALQLAPAVLETSVEAGVLDRDAGPLRQNDAQLLVLLGEGLTAGLLGEVEVSPGLTADQHGHADEGRHRRVGSRKPV
jgi:hypothetical protein